MSLLHLAAEGRAIMSGLQKEGIKNWAEFLKLYPQWFALAKNNTRVRAVERDDAPTSAASSAAVVPAEPVPADVPAVPAVVPAVPAAVPTVPTAVPAEPVVPAAPPSAASSAAAPKRAVRDASYFKALRHTYGRSP